MHALKTLKRLKTLETLTKCCLPAALVLMGSVAQANDFPTAERVLYVQECMRAHPGPQYEMINKCSCALDALASKVKFDDYMTMNTAANANSIGGERGSYIRDNESMKQQVKRYRELQSQAKAGCFISTAAR